MDQPVNSLPMTEQKMCKAAGHLLLLGGYMIRIGMPLMHGNEFQIAHLGDSANSLGFEVRCIDADASPGIDL